MKNGLLIFGGLILVGGIGFLAYRHFFYTPKFVLDVSMPDWVNKNVQYQVRIDGSGHSETSGTVQLASPASGVQNGKYNLQVNKIGNTLVFTLDVMGKRVATKTVDFDKHTIA